MLRVVLSAAARHSISQVLRETFQENVGPARAEVLEAVEGLALLVGQSKHSTDCIISFVEELFHNLSTLSKMLQVLIEIRLFGSRHIKGPLYLAGLFTKM